MLLCYDFDPHFYNSKFSFWNTIFQVTFEGCLILAGLLGPTIWAEVYDTVVITLKNMASHPVSLHAVGVSYWKASEGKSNAFLLSYSLGNRKMRCMCLEVVAVLAHFRSLLQNT